MSEAMDMFKRDNFRRLNPGRPFPAIGGLSEGERNHIREQIAIRLGGSPTRPGSEVVQQIAEEGELVPGVDAKNRHIELLPLLDQLGLDYSEHALLNWGQFEELDRVRLRDLDEFFSDIWYPDSDDLDIIDADCDWVLSVRHDGVVSVLRLSR